MTHELKLKKIYCNLENKFQNTTDVTVLLANDKLCFQLDNFKY